MAYSCADCLIGNLNSASSMVGKQISWSSYRNSRQTRRPLRVHGLFGGKKENNEKGEDANSKVNQANFLFILLYLI